jgi:hypothetical protein
MIEFGENFYAIHGRSWHPYGPGRTREELEHLASLCLQVWGLNWIWPSSWHVKIENDCAIVTTPGGVKAAYPLLNTLNWKDIFSRQALQEREIAKPEIT